MAIKLLGKGNERKIKRGTREQNCVYEILGNGTHQTQENNLRNKGTQRKFVGNKREHGPPLPPSPREALSTVFTLRRN